jgi:hypothetical protein
MESVNKHNPTSLEEELAITENASNYFFEEEEYKKANELRKESRVLTKMIKRQNTTGITVKEFIVSLSSQNSSYGNPVMRLECQSGRSFNLIERNPDSEDGSVICTNDALIKGVKLTDLLKSLKQLDEEGLGDSFVDHDNNGNPTWQLYLDTELDGRSLVLRSHDICRVIK